jgi:hypothetical protein
MNTMSSFDANPKTAVTDAIDYLDDSDDSVYALEEDKNPQLRLMKKITIHPLVRIPTSLLSTTMKLLTRACKSACVVRLLLMQ